eukprot:7991089-Pyramimonas_sp.AAC.1
MFFHLETILTQPLIAAIGTHVITVPTHWALTRSPLFVSFPRAPIFRAPGPGAPGKLAVSLLVLLRNRHREESGDTVD